jgi:phospholipase/lecithinase/hemolysin
VPKPASRLLTGSDSAKPLGSSMTRPIFGIITTVLIMCAAFDPNSLSARERGFDTITVFGDSLSDTGNAAGARFTNGPVWVEHIARHFGLSVDPVSSGGTNYAVGGARAYEPGSPYNLRAQVDGWLRREPEREVVERSLFIVYGGANDLLAAVYGQDPVVLAMNAVRVLGTIADDLASAGARHILIANLPDLAKVPAVRQYGAGVGQVATRTTTGFNEALDQTLAGVEARHGVRILRLDVFSLTERVFRDPGVLGVTGIDLTIPCQNNGRVCSDPDRRLFWDHVHPTAFAHARLARAALEVLNGDKRDGAL